MVLGMVEALAALLGIPADAPVFVEALTHPSYANESRQGSHNQRLEFLGDAVLELCCSHALYLRYPDAAEGELTRRRSQLVNTDALARFARNNGVAEALILGKGAEANGLRESNNVLADTVEALLAATYLSAGLEAAARIVHRLIDEVSADLERGAGRDAKTALQELVQSQGKAAPAYAVTDSGGPPHERWFKVQVLVDGVAIGSGRDRSKRLAEMAAAREAISQMGAATGEPPP